MATTPFDTPRSDAAGAARGYSGVDILKDTLRREQAARQRAMRRSLGGARGTAPGTVSNALLMDEQRRANASEERRAVEEYLAREREARGRGRILAEQALQMKEERAGMRQQQRFRQAAFDWGTNNRGNPDLRGAWDAYTWRNRPKNSSFRSGNPFSYLSGM